MVAIKHIIAQTIKDVKNVVNPGNFGYYLSMAKQTIEEERKEENKALNAFEKLMKRVEQVPKEELDKLPTDGSINYKHYLYGHPKR